MNKRLPPLDSHWIDRDRPIQFRFEGRQYQGYEGDLLSSALWGAGCRVLGRSFKYHRPRGVYSLAGHDANVMLEDGVSDAEVDKIFQSNGVTLFVDPISIRYLAGAEVDFVDNLSGGGFTIKNPNAKSTCGCGQSFEA